jgi:hypothetical protein
MFDHIPDVREQWLRVSWRSHSSHIVHILYKEIELMRTQDYLENLEAASGSTTVHHVGQLR